MEDGAGMEERGGVGVLEGGGGWLHDEGPGRSHHHGLWSSGQVCLEHLGKFAECNHIV